MYFSKYSLFMILALSVMYMIKALHNDTIVPDYHEIKRTTNGNTTEHTPQKKYTPEKQRRKNEASVRHIFICADADTPYYTERYSERIHIADYIMSSTDEKSFEDFKLSYISEEKKDILKRVKAQYKELETLPLAQYTRAVTLLNEYWDALADNKHSLIFLSDAIELSKTEAIDECKRELDQKRTYKNKESFIHQLFHFLFYRKKS